MVFTRKNGQSNRGFHNQLENFDQDIIIGNTVSDKQRNTTVSKNTGDQEFTVGTSDKILMTTEKMVNVKTL